MHFNKYFSECLRKRHSSSGSLFGRLRDTAADFKEEEDEPKKKSPLATQNSTSSEDSKGGEEDELQLR